MVTEVVYKGFRAEIKQMTDPYGVIWGTNDPKLTVVGFSKSVESAIERVRKEVDKYYGGKENVCKKEEMSIA